jgi:hypothetical protein
MPSHRSQPRKPRKAQLHQAVIVGLILVLCTSCTTWHVWNWADPTDYVMMSHTDETRDYLAKRHLDFYEDAEQRVYFVEKNGLQKFKDYTIRTFATPVTLTVDTATTIVVVGAAVWLVAHGAGSSTISPYHSAQYWKDQEELSKTIHAIRLEGL